VRRGAGQPYSGRGLAHGLLSASRKWAATAVERGRTYRKPALYFATTCSTWTAGLQVTARTIRRVNRVQVRSSVVKQLPAGEIRV